MHKLLNKKEVSILKEGFNPYLDGSITSGSTCANIDMSYFNTFDDRPNMDGSCTGDEYGEVDGPINRYQLVATFVNGQPLTPWSAMFMNGQLAHSTHASNMQNLYGLIRNKIRDAFGKKLKFKDNLDDISVDNIKILSIDKINDIKIKLNITFDLNEYTDIFCTIINYDKLESEFVCSEISHFDKETKLKIEGMIINAVDEFMIPSTGYYVLLSNEFYIYTLFGKLEKIKSGDVIEVLNSTKEDIRIKRGDKLYIIKKPDYYYFNWFFTKK